MRRILPGLVAVGAAAALALTGCSSGSSSSTASASAPAGSAAASAGSSDSGAVLGAANIASVMAAYTGPDSKLPKTFGPAAEDGALKIGWSSPNDGNELISRLGTAVEAATKAKGGTFVMYDAQADVGKQVGQIQQLVNDKVDAIVVWPLAAEALAPSLKLAKEAGIPVVAMEVAPDGSTELGDYTGQIIYGRDMMAYVTSNLMSQLFPGGELAVVKFAVPVPSMIFYAERVTAYATEAGMKPVGTFDVATDTVAGGQEMAAPVLSKYPNLQSLISFNDPTAIGATAAARAASRELTAFGGNGEDAGIEAVKSGQLALTVQPPLDVWATELVNGAYLAKAGTEIPKTIFPALGNVITKETVAEAKKLSDLAASIG